MKTDNTLPNKLFDLLLSKNFSVKTLTSTGKEQTDVASAEMLSFDFLSGDKNYGPVILLLNDDKELEIFYGDTIGRSMDADAKQEWTELLYQLRITAKRFIYGFSLNNINRLRHTVKGRAAMNEGTIFEGYYGTKKTSYNPQGTAKIIIKHSKSLAEDDKRYRYINAIFIENADGERFKLPFKTLPGARAMARHVTEGGNPYDIFGLHISEMVGDVNTLRGFVRRSKMFEEGSDASQLAEVGKSHYTGIRTALKQIAGKRGYHTYKESWNPATITETDIDLDSIRKVFTHETINPSVEQALPLIAKLNDQKQMKEINEFEEWAEDVSSNLLTMDEINKINEFMAVEQPVGIDALNVLTQLEVIENASLIDQLTKLSQTNPDADARSTVMTWIENNMPQIATKIIYKEEEMQTEDLDKDGKKELYAGREQELDDFTTRNREVHEMDELSLLLKQTTDLLTELK